MNKENKNIGNYGEDLASQYLENNNHKIINKNFTIRQGEIDIISIINNILVFTEVKSRYSKKYGTPLESISYSKMKNIKFLASYFIYKNKLYDYNVRFDVIEVMFNYYDNEYKINHIKDAFR